MNSQQLLRLLLQDLRRLKPVHVTAWWGRVSQTPAIATEELFTFHGCEWERVIFEGVAHFLADVTTPMRIPVTLIILIGLVRD